MFNLLYVKAINVLLIVLISTIVYACNGAGKSENNQAIQTDKVLVNLPASKDDNANTIFLTRRIPRAVNVGVSSLIGIDFTVDLESTTVTPLSFTIIKKGGSNIDGVIKVVNDHKFIFKPKQKWELNTTYKILFNSAIKYKTGKPITQRAYSFTTQPGYQIFEATNSDQGTYLAPTCWSAIIDPSNAGIGGIIVGYEWNGSCAGSGFSGDLKSNGSGKNGLSGADNLCNNSAQKPSKSNSVYKALIADSGDTSTVTPARQACTTISTCNANNECTSSISCDSTNQSNWVLKPSTAYYNQPGVAYTASPYVKGAGEHIVTPSAMIGITTSNSIFNFNLLSPFTYLSLPTSWTGLSSDWTTNSNTCNNWAAGDANTLGNTGLAFNPSKVGVISVAQTLDSHSIANSKDSCNTILTGLYCVEQAATAMVIPDTSEAIPTNTAVVIQFGYTIAAASVNSNSFQVVPANGGQPVNGSISGSGTTYTFTPSSALLINTTYNVKLTSDIIDGVGNSVPASNFSFTTSNVAPPEMTIPAESQTQITNIQTQIQVVFGADIDLSTATTSTFTLSPSTAGSVSCVTNTCTFTPTTDLNYGTQYTVSLNNIKYIDGTPVVAITFAFTTATEPAAPTMLIPGNTNYTDIFTPVQIQFSEDVDTTTVNSNTFIISPSVAGTITGSGKVYTFVPSSALTESTIYTISLNNIKYADGYSYTSTVPSTTFTFKTLALNSPKMTSPLPTSRINASTDTSIEIQFPSDIDISKLNSSNFMIYEIFNTGTPGESDITVKVKTVNSNTIKLVPDQELRIDALEKVELLNVMRNDGSLVYAEYDFTTQGVEMIQPPHGRRLDMSTNESIIIQFPTDVDASSINESTVILYEYIGESISNDLLNANVNNNASISSTCITNEACWVAIVAVLMYSQVNNILTIQSTDYLQKNTAYRVGVDVKDTSGDPILANYIVRTGTQEPKMITPKSTTNVSVYTDIVFKFPEKLNPNQTITSDNFIVISKRNGPVEGRILVSPFMLKFVPKPRFDDNDVITITLKDIEAMDFTYLDDVEVFETTDDDVLIIYEAINNGLGFRGDFGGIVQADYICNHDPNMPDQNRHPATYKAMIASNNNVLMPDRNDRYPCIMENGVRRCGGRYSRDWVLRSNTEYYNRTYEERLGATTADAIFENDFTATIRTEPNNLQGTWTGFNANWTVNIGRNCLSWNDGGGDLFSTIGTPTSTIIANVISGRIAECNIGQSIYCVEQ